MRLYVLKMMTAIFVICASPLTYAATCSLTPSAIFTAYAPTGVVPNVTQGSIDVTCSKNFGGLDPNNTNYTISVNNGVNATGTQNRARLTGTNYLSYETARNNGCNTSWGSAAADSFTGTGTYPFTATFNYWGCITAAGQTVPAGLYTDTVTVTISYSSLFGITATNTATFAVNITNPATCSITSIGNVAFGSYQAFRATPLNAPNATINLNCTKDLPYSLSLDATTGVVSGLNYSLSLSATDSRGTGANQTPTISGTMPANQAGTCTGGTCAGSQQRFLTITY